MFRFISLISAVYFYHRGTRKYLGTEHSSKHGNVVVKPVDDISKAVNFKIREGLKTVSNPSSTNHFEGLAPSNIFVRITDQTGKRSFDAKTGIIRNGNVLIMYPNHNAIAQKMKIQLLSNMSFAFGWEDRCFKYDKSDNVFMTGSCSGLTNNDTFDIMVETSSSNGKLVVKEEYNLSDDADSNNENDSIFYHPNSKIVISAPSTKVKRQDGSGIVNLNDLSKNANKVHEYNEITNYGRDTDAIDDNGSSKSYKRRHGDSNSSFESREDEDDYLNHYEKFHRHGRKSPRRHGLTQRPKETKFI